MVGNTLTTLKRLWKAAKDRALQLAQQASRDPASLYYVIDQLEGYSERWHDAELFPDDEESEHRDTRVLDWLLTATLLALDDPIHLVGFAKHMEDRKSIRPTVLAQDYLEAVKAWLAIGEVGAAVDFIAKRRQVPNVSVGEADGYVLSLDWTSVHNALRPRAYEDDPPKNLLNRVPREVGLLPEN